MCIQFLLLTELKTTVKYFISIFELAVVVVNVVIYWKRERMFNIRPRKKFTNETCICGMRRKKKKFEIFFSY